MVVRVRLAQPLQVRTAECRSRAGEALTTRRSARLSVARRQAYGARDRRSPSTSLPGAVVSKSAARRTPTRSPAPAVCSSSRPTSIPSHRAVTPRNSKTSPTCIAPATTVPTRTVPRRGIGTSRSSSKSTSGTANTGRKHAAVGMNARRSVLLDDRRVVDVRRARHVLRRSPSMSASEAGARAGAMMRCCARGGSLPLGRPRLGCGHRRARKPWMVARPCSCPTSCRLRALRSCDAWMEPPTECRRRCPSSWLVGPFARLDGGSNRAGLRRIDMREPQRVHGGHV